MTRYTTAYSSFLARLAEVEILRGFAEKKERENPILLRDEINALSRGAIVLLSSHLEAYVKELGELAIESLAKNNVQKKELSYGFFYHISKDLIDEIKNTVEPEKIGKKMSYLFDRDYEFWSKSGTFTAHPPSERFNQGFSNPAYKKIKTYFNRFGYTDYNVDLTHRLRGNYQPITNMIDHLVDIRNKIAHGDPAATKTPREVLDMILFVQKFCKETDDVFASWWKAKYCALRR